MIFLVHYSVRFLLKCFFNMYFGGEFWSVKGTSRALRPGSGTDIPNSQHSSLEWPDGHPLSGVDPSQSKSSKVDNSAEATEYPHPSG